MFMKQLFWSLIIPASFAAQSGMAFQNESETDPPASATEPATEGDSGPVEDTEITAPDQVVPVAEDPPTDVPPASDAAPAAGPAETGDGATPEASGPPAEASGDPELSEHDRLAQTFGRFQELRDAGMLDEAENAAKQAVELSLTVSGPGSNDTAKALTNLGMVQYDTQNYEAAEQNFQSAINIYKENEDQLSERLINPLRGLGAAQLESGRPDEAMQTFRQAVHISHVNEGPHNAGQTPILEALAETQLRMGSLEDARDTQDMIYALNLRHNEGDRLGMVEPLMRLAAWQRRTGFVLDERQTYMRVIRIIEDEKGKDDISLIEPLLNLAESYYYVEDSSATLQASAIANGELYFKRAIHIAEESPEADWRVQADTMLALADYYTFRADVTRSRRAYREVWELLSTDDERLAVRHEQLEQVHSLNEDPIPQYIGDATLAGRQQQDRDVREGSVVASYDVSARGRMSTLRIVELNPPEFSDMQDEVVRELRNRLYRPRFVDAEPVDTTNLMITHRFFYLQSDLDERLEAGKEGDDGSKEGDEGG
jgi:tetratricopeptide (TPR) repeat protein